MEPKVTITNLEGRYALFMNGGASIEELERYDTQAEAVSGLNEHLGDAPAQFFIVDRQAKERVYEMAWQGRTPAPVEPVKAEEEPAPSEPEAEDAK